MKVTEAAATWVECKTAIAEAEKRMKPATEALKAHFRSRTSTSFKGVGYSKTTYTALDVEAARKALGDKAAACEVERSRETLSLLKK